MLAETKPDVTVLVGDRIYCSISFRMEAVPPADIDRQIFCVKDGDFDIRSHPDQQEEQIIDLSFQFVGFHFNSIDGIGGGGG